MAVTKIREIFQPSLVVLKGVVRSETSVLASFTAAAKSRIVHYEDRGRKQRNGDLVGVHRRKHFPAMSDAEIACYLERRILASHRCIASDLNGLGHL